jgi:predicted DNA-binding transcriptional regulator AlpA
MSLVRVTTWGGLDGSHPAGGLVEGSGLGAAVAACRLSADPCIVIGKPWTPIFAAEQFGKLRPYRAINRPSRNETLRARAGRTGETGETSSNHDVRASPVLMHNRGEPGRRETREIAVNTCIAFFCSVDSDTCIAGIGTEGPEGIGANGSVYSIGADQFRSRSMAQQITPNASRLLREGEAAKVLGVSVALLRKWRAERSGPTVVRLGRCVRYVDADLQSFIRSRSEAR